MNPEDIIEALEQAVASRRDMRVDAPANASKRDILNYKQSVMRFLDELDAELTIGEVRAVLGEYE